MGAIQCSHRNEWNLMPPGRHDRPTVLGPKKLIGDSLGMQQILRVCTRSTKNPENRLHEQRRLHQTTVEKVGQRVEVGGVIALEFEAGTMPSPEHLQNG